MKKSRLLLVPIFAMAVGALSSCDSVDKLATMAVDIQSQITDMQSDIDALKNQVEDLKKQINDLDTEKNAAIKKVEDDYLAKVTEIETSISNMQKSISDLTAQLEKDKKELEDDYNAKINNLKTTHDADIAALDAKNEEALATLKNNYDTQLAAIEADYKARIAALQEDYDAQLAAITADYQERIATLKANYDTQLAALTANYDSELSTLKSNYDTQLASMTQDYNTKLNGFQTTYQTKVAEIEGNISAANARITALQSQMNTQVQAIQNDYNGKINELTGRVATLEQVTTHTVNFDTKGGNEIASQIVIHGEKAKKPVDPVKAGSTFKGWTYQDEPWYFSGSVVTEDMTLTANWEQINYTATFKNDDGAVLQTLQNVHYGDILTYTGSNPVKPNPEDHYGYTFTGWDNDLLVTGDMEFIAQYNKEYLPFQEKYLGPDEEVIFSRYVQENEGFIELTQGDNVFESIDGLVYFEFEDCLLKGDGNIWEAENSRGKKTIANTNTSSSMEYHIESSRSVSAMLGVCGAAAYAKSHSLNYYFSLFVNDVEVNIPDSSKMTHCNDWDDWELADCAIINLKKGDNKILFKCKNSINYDYFTLGIDTFDITTFGVAEPTKLNEGTLMFQFSKWELASNENDVLTYRPVFEQATIGLEFDGEKVDVYHGAATEVYVPARWNKQNIRRIGYESFAFSDVEIVHLPETIERIEHSAFFQAKKLTTINLPASLTVLEYMVFQECPKLVNVELNEGLVEIHNHVFDRSGIKNVVIPSTVTKILDHAFYEIKADFIYIPATVQSIDWNAFYSSNEYPNVIYCEREYRPSSYTGDWANNSYIVWGYQAELEKDGYKYAISNVSGEKSLTLIDFDDSIVNFNVPERVDNMPVVGARVYFNNNTKLETVILPDCIKTIGNDAFKGCSSLTSISIPGSVESIGDRAFQNCAKLTTVELHEGLKTIGYQAFCGCKKLQNITLPNGITAISGHAFEGCTALTKLDIPESIESLREAVFACAGLTSAILPNGLKVIPDGLFSQCKSLVYVVIPESIETIEGYSFYDDPALSKIYYMGNAEKWNTYEIDGTNDQINHATKYFYSESEPQEAGNYWHYVEGVPTIW